VGARGPVRGSVVAAVAFLIPLLKACQPPAQPGPPPANPVNDIVYEKLDSRQQGLFLTYPSVSSANASAYWTSSLNVTQRVEFAGGLQALELEVEKPAKLSAVTGVTAINGSDPSAASEDQFNNAVIWDRTAAARIRSLPNWSEHIALLHPGQYGYQENRDGNPFLGLVVLFDENPANPLQPGGQFHIGFRTWFGHYEAENGDIRNSDNYKLYATWYGYIGDYVPLP
jgi:hypothetical protein